MSKLRNSSKRKRARSSLSRQSHSQRILWSAFRIASLVFIVAILMMVVVGTTLAERITTQQIAFGITGAILQAAFLGLIYEVWLRDEVEDATLEKLGTSRDVKEHGLIRLDAEVNIDWSNLLDGATQLTIITNRPETVIGAADDLIIRNAGSGSLTECRVAVPESAWTERFSWCERFRDAWAAAAPSSSVFFIKLPTYPGFDLIATETRAIMLMRPAVAAPGVEALKLLEFRARNAHGIGSWLSRQNAVLFELQASFGYSPPEATPSAIVAEPTAAEEEETLA